MKLNSTTVAPALRALLEEFIDYAGTFPPASDTLDTAQSNFCKYSKSDYCWMLRYLVVSRDALASLPADLNGKLSILSEQDEERAATIESKAVVEHSAHPVYCEVPLNELDELQTVKQSGCLAKIRTGGVKAEMIPSSRDVAAFICACAEHKLAFKATAGLHHPVRSEQALTYEPDAPRAVMHGFLNVLLAAAFAWNGDRDIEPVIAETDPSAFTFGANAAWRGRSLSAEQIREARLNFVHSVGSCSFTEPVEELKQLGLL